MVNTPTSKLSRVLFVLIFLGAFSLSGKSQSNTLFASTYYGDFKMKDIKDLQSRVLSESTLPLRVTEEISGYWGYELDYRFSLSEKNRLGFYSGFISTGGRLYYSDFSGFTHFDIVSKGYYIGSEFFRKINKSETLDVNLSFRAGATFSNLEINSGLSLVNSGSSLEELLFVSTNIHLAPQVSVEKSFKRLLVRVFTGYEYNVKGDVRLKENREVFLTNNNEAIGVDWGGLRIGFSCGIGF